MCFPDGFWDAEAESASFICCKWILLEIWCIPFMQKLSKSLFEDHLKMVWCLLDARLCAEIIKIIIWRQFVNGMRQIVTVSCEFTMSVEQMKILGSLSTCLTWTVFTDWQIDLFTSIYLWLTNNLRGWASQFDTDQIWKDSICISLTYMDQPVSLNSEIIIKASDDNLR